MPTGRSRKRSRKYEIEEESTAEQNRRLMKEHRLQEEKRRRESAGGDFDVIYDKVEQQRHDGSGRVGRSAPIFRLRADAHLCQASGREALCLFDVGGGVCRHVLICPGMDGLHRSVWRETDCYRTRERGSNGDSNRPTGLSTLPPSRSQCLGNRGDLAV